MKHTSVGPSTSRKLSQKPVLAGILYYFCLGKFLRLALKLWDELRTEVHEGE